MNTLLTPQQQTTVDNINTWIARLQSGKLKQARSVLRKRNGAMCCLGVAAEMLHERGECERKFVSLATAYSYDMNDTKLTKYKLFGLLSPEGKGSQRPRKLRQYFIERCNSLASLNDNGEFVWMGKLRAVNFAYIAERLLLDLRTGDLGYFTPEARRAWLEYHGFSTENL